MLRMRRHGEQDRIALKMKKMTMETVVGAALAASSQVEKGI